MNSLEGIKIKKVFPGTVALDDVTVCFKGGSVNALVGKNGSGKSTLLKIFAGVHTPTSGDVILNGKKISIKNESDAIDKGIATVYQELSLIPSLSVMENILINRLPKKNKIIDWTSARKKTKKLLNELGIDVSPDELVENLTMWQMQMIEIAKAVSYEPQVLFLDEPTSSLAKSEVSALFNVINKLKKKGLIIVYVSHKLDELWEVCDTCTVLRDGHYIGKVEMANTSKNELIKMMFGDVVIPKRPNDLMISDEVVLKVENLCRKGKFENISFVLHKGEVLGIAGMLGSGRTELLKSIFGADSFDSGTIYFNNQVIKKADLIKMKNNGMALTPEDRKYEGLILDDSISNNLCYASLGKLSKKSGFIDRKRRNEFIQKQIQNLQIKVADSEFSVDSLSGGNQQKVVVGNWLNTEPTVMFFDEPSRGIDIDSKQQIFKIMWEQSRNGISSIMVSTELEELLEVCQRILIMHAGKIIGEVNPDEINNEQLYALCMGEN